MVTAMKSGRARPSRAWFVSGIVATAVVVSGGLPAPGQVEPLTPEITYIDAYGPGILGYEDCDGVIHTEESSIGWAYIELDEPVEIDTSVGITFGGSLADDLVDPPATIEVAAGDDWSEAEFRLDALEVGDLTVTAEPGLGYVADADDTFTLEISDEPELVASCKDDFGTPPGNTDRQIIDVGGTPVPIGFFEEDDEDPDPGPEPTISEPPTPSTTTTEATTTTEVTTTTEEPTTTDASDQSTSFAQVRAASARYAPEGYDTVVANGTIPAGLTYVDDEWTGTATTAGLSSFDIRVCFDQRSFLADGGRRDGARRPAMRAFPDVICLGYVDVQIAVLADDTAPPAQAVTADANFAG